MSGDKLGSSNEPPSKTPGSTTPGKDEKVASSTNTKAADGIFKLEETFPNLQDLLQPHVLPPLKSQDVIVALDTNALLLPFELKPGNLASLESVYERLRKEDRLIVPGRALREFVNLRDKKLANLVQALNNRKGNQQYELTLKLITVEQATKAASPHYAAL
jgi:PIN like domain